MPLFSYKCETCDKNVEKFLHQSSPQIMCECGQTMNRILSRTQGRVKLNAYDTLQEQTLPEVDKLIEKAGAGSDAAFLDIAGE